MKRGEIWTLSGGPGYTGKPRPALIVQSDRLTGTGSLLTCGVTSHEHDPLRSRPLLEPSPGNGLRNSSVVMIDKLTAVPRSKLGRRIGALTPGDMERVEDAMLFVLGFAG